MSAIIKLSNVSWAYSRSREWALKNISVEIGEGEFIALMGENGSGKTTFCRLINGLIPHSLNGTLLGAVTVDGVLTSSSTVAELAKKTGMVFDDPQTQLLTAGVYDELAFGLENLMVDPDKIREKISRVLGICGLEEYRHKPPSVLSGGQKQRLAIASALIMANKILVLDEPSSQLDSSGAEEVLSLIRDSCVKNGLTVLMATGSGEEAVEFADKICVLKNGCVAAFDSPRHIFADQKLADYSAVQIPQVSDFAREMAALGKPLPDFPVNTEEAVASVLKWYNGKK
jgi:energy-coupling factor transporter ATP-binding protein EcfA2